MNGHVALLPPSFYQSDQYQGDDNAMKIDAVENCSVF